MPLLRDKNEVDQLNAAVLEYTAHCHNNVRSQAESFRNALVNLDEHEVLLLFDFSPYKKCYNKDRTMTEAFNSVQSLHICAYFGTENKETPPSLTYYDYFASEKNDYFYFETQ